MGKHTSHQLKRNNLFLVRVWSEEPDEEGSGATHWHGRVQRVVDGESHKFDNLQDLVEQLLVMLSGAATQPSPADGAEK